MKSMSLFSPEGMELDQTLIHVIVLKPKCLHIVVHLQVQVMYELEDGFIG